MATEEGTETEEEEIVQEVYYSEKFNRIVLIKIDQDCSVFIASCEHPYGFLSMGSRSDIVMDQLFLNGYELIGFL